MTDEGENKRGKTKRSSAGNFNQLPEGCVAAAISFTGPRDACRLATVSKLFKSAAYYDAVWASFLPPDYRDIIARSGGNGGEGLDLLSVSKRELFFHLAHRRLLIDASTKSFFLDKSTGKKCFTLSARELNIVWGDTPRYWSFHPFPGSRFPEVAELQAVCWLEIKGKMKASMLSPNTYYTAYFVFKITGEAYGFYSPAQVTVTVAAPVPQIDTRKVYLKYLEGDTMHQMVPRRMILFNRVQTPIFDGPPSTNMLPRERPDGWLEVEIGVLATGGEGEDGEVEMLVKEVAGTWKSGLIVEGIEIRPSVRM